MLSFSVGTALEQYESQQPALKTHSSRSKADRQDWNLVTRQAALSTQAHAQTPKSTKTVSHRATSAKAW
jgi:hypothetical protein